MISVSRFTARDVIALLVVMSVACVTLPAFGFPNVFFLNLDEVQSALDSIIHTLLFTETLAHFTFVTLFLITHRTKKFGYITHFALCTISRPLSY